MHPFQSSAEFASVCGFNHFLSLALFPVVSQSPCLVASIFSCFFPRPSCEFWLRTTSSFFVLNSQLDLTLLTASLWQLCTARSHCVFVCIPFSACWSLLRAPFTWHSGYSNECFCVWSKNKWWSLPVQILLFWYFSALKWFALWKKLIHLGIMSTICKILLLSESDENNKPV